MGEGDSIIIFVTDEAYKANWKKGISYENEIIDGGLEKVLHKFADDKSNEVKPINIPGGQNDKKIWGIFDAVINSVNP